MQQIIKDQGLYTSISLLHVLTHTVNTYINEEAQFGSSATCKALAPALTLVSVGELEINVLL